VHVEPVEHGVDGGAGSWRTPVCGSQESTEQTLLSLVSIGVPAHVPDTQPSLDGHALPSVHALPSAAGLTTH
jgi:hypothetical protein